MANYYLRGGTVSSGIILNSSDSMIVSSGGTASDTTVEMRGSLIISSGGNARGVTVNSGGVFDILSGGTATSVMENGGAVWYTEGASVTFLPNSFSNLTLHNHLENATVHSGTTATDILVESYATLSVSSGGTGNLLTAISGGWLVVDSGGTMTGLTIEPVGSLTVLSGGTANDITINSGGAVTVSSGGTALNTTINAWSDLIVSEGATISGVTVNSGGNAGGEIGTVVDDVEIKSGGRWAIFGNTANRIKVDFGGILDVWSNGKATEVMENGGYVRYYSKENEEPDVTYVPNSFSNTVLNESQTATVHSGTTAVSTTINYQGLLEIYSGGTANSTTINSGGSLNVFNGGNASQTTVNSSGVMLIRDKSIIDDMTVNPHAWVYVASGVTATSVVENGGYISISDGADVTFTPHTFDGLILEENQSASVHSGTTATNTKVNGGRLDVFQGGEIDGTVFSGEELNIYGGTANNTTLMSFGSMEVYVGGVVNSTNVASKGSLSISRGAVADHTTVSLYGCVTCYAGGLVVDTTVGGSLSYTVSFYDSAYLSVESGGSASNTVVDVHGRMDVSSGGKVDNTEVNGILMISSGATANVGTVNSSGYVYVGDGYAADFVIDSGGSMQVSLNGQVENTTVNSGGSLALSGGRIEGLVLNSGAKISFSSGAVLSNTVVNPGFVWKVGDAVSAVGIIENGGYVEASPTATFQSHAIQDLVLGENQSATVHSGTTAVNTIVSSRGSLNIYRGGIADGIVVSRGGKLAVDCGTTVTGVKVMNSGYLDMVLDSGTNISGIFGGSTFTVEAGLISGFEVNSLKSLTMQDGGTAENTVVTSGGILLVSSGGIANVMTVSSTGAVYVSGGGIASGTEICSGGSMVIQESGSAFGLNVSSGGSISLRAGATVTGLAVSNGGWIEMNVAEATHVAGTSGESEFEMKDGRLDGLTLNHGTVNVMTGGSAYDLTLKNDALLTVVGGLVHGLDASNNGFNSVDGRGAAFVKGGLLTGKITVTGGTVYFYNDGGILFNVSDLTPDTDTTRINDYRKIALSPILLATVSDAQMEGRYILARNAEGFNNYITVNNEDGTFQEELSVGQQFELAGKTYALCLDDGVLSLDVSTTADSVVITLDGDVTTPLQSTVLTASAPAESELYFSTDNRTWTPYDKPLTVTENGTYFFKALDNAGNIGTQWISVSNVDRVPPDRPFVSADVTGLTNGPVTVSAIFSNDTAMKEYSLDNQNWAPYSGGVAFDDNGVVYFRGMDAAGNISEVASYTVGNIIQGPVPTVSGQVVRNSTVSVKENEYYENIVIDSSGILIVSSGGTANTLQIRRLGDLVISSGGTATNILWTPGIGHVFVYEGGYVTYSSSYAGVYLASNGYSLSHALTMSAETLNKFYEMNVLSGGTANNTIINDIGSMFVSSGGLANSTSISSGGSMTVSSGGRANGTMISGGGRLIVSSGGMATGVTTTSSGFVDVWGYVENAYLSGGIASCIATIYQGGILSSATVVGGADLIVSGSVYDVVVEKGKQNGDLSDLWLDAGYAENITVNKDGNFVIHSGTTGVNTTVNSGGWMRVMPGGKITGQMSFVNGATVDVQYYGSGAIIDFDISDLKPDNEARLNNLSLVSSWQSANFTLTISSSQELGTYLLANGAAGFDRTITVQNTLGEALGVLTIGTVLQLEDLKYELSLDGNTLSFRIDQLDQMAPTISGIAASPATPTNRDVTVTAVFADDVKLVSSLYRIGENGAWTDYVDGVTVSDNTVVYFKAVDGIGNETEASYTVDNIDRTAPVITDVTLAQGKDDYVFTATATATDDRTAASELKYYTRHADRVAALSEADANAGPSFAGTESDAGRILYYQVGVEDAAGNVTWSEAKSLTVMDHTAPVLNGQPQATYSERSISVTWEEASDNIAVAGYRLILNDEVHELHTPGYQLGDVGIGTYTYQVVAYDEAGNETGSEVRTLTVGPRADLRVLSVQALKGSRPATTISNLDNVTLSIQFGNPGDLKSSATTAHIYCGEVRLAEIAVAGINPDGVADCMYTIEAGRMTSGIQDIRVVVDAYDTVSEYSEKNNEKTLTLNVENHSACDLVIGSIRLDKPVYSAEDNAVLTFTVNNIGYIEAPASKAYVYADDVLLGSMNVDALEAGTATDALSYVIAAESLTPGSHAIRIAADGAKEVPETNRENNSAQIQLVVGLCDLNVGKLTLSQGVCDTDEDVTLTFTVRNSGTDKAADSIAEIYDGNNLLGSVAIGELAAGLSVSKQFVVSAGTLSAGLHDFRVAVDAKSTVAEADETNNTHTITLQVNQKDDSAPILDEESITVSQDTDGYGFAVSVLALDNLTPASRIAYGVRFAETAERLENADVLEGKTFALTPDRAGKTLYYQVSATDLAGNTTWSLARSFTVADHTAPEIGNVTVSTTESTLRLSWEASDNAGLSLYKVYCDGELVSTQDAAVFTQDSVSVGSHIYRIEAYDAAGNMATTGNVKVNFDDAVAPVIESVGAVQSADGYDITFSILATDNETQAADLVSRVQVAFAEQDVEDAPLGGLNLILAPEDAGRTLYYRVSASDEAGNTTWSEIRSLTVADRTAPEAPADLTGTVNGFAATLNWTAPTDNVGVTGYQVRYGTTDTLNGDGVVVAGTQYELTELKEGVYFWQAAAIDAASNVSDWSEAKSFRILPEDAFGAINTAEQAYDLGTLSGEQTLTGGAIASADGADWFKFALNAKGTANDYVQISFDNKIGDLDLYLYSANSTTLLLSADGTTGDTEKISLKDLQKGTYLLKAVGKDGAMNTFSIATKKVAGYDMDVYDANGRNDSMVAATVFDLEKTPQATVSGLNLHEAGDEDYYQFTLANMGLSGDGVSISFENSVGDLDLVLFDSKGVKIAESAGTGNVETISFSGLAAGSYYVLVTAAHNAVNEYTLNWNFASNKVEVDALEGQEPYAIAESVELANLSISAAGDGVTQEDTFTLTLNQPGSATSKIRFSNYRSDWTGLKYVVKDGGDAIVLSGVGSELSLDGLAAGEYSLTVDTSVAGSFSPYDISVSLPESAETKWTYMVYMAADSNLDTYALCDLIAMQQAALDSQIDIYVLVDRSATSAYELSGLATRNKWDSAWSDTRVGKITYNPSSTVSVDWESWGELDTSSITTLKTFVDWVQGESRSENYALLMWDHGKEDGSLCVDGTTDADWGTSLSVSDVSALLTEKGNIPLVIFNNCLLGSEIVATQMTGSTDVIVVSEAESHPQNSTYAYKTFFSAITADMNAQDMAKVLVQNVQQYGDGTQPSMLSAVDVTDSRLATALEHLAAAVAAANNANDMTVLINGMAKTLQDGCAYAGSTVYQSDLYDMIVQAMADRRYAGTSDAFKTALASLKTALEDVVLVSRSVPENRGYGIATFNPVLTVKTYAASGYKNERIDSILKSYLEANYAANPAWSGLLYDLAAAYLTQYGASVKTASFSVSSIVDLGKDELISSMDLGCFSGRGEVIDGINLLGDLYLGVTITSEATSTGGFTVTNDSNAAVTISILAEDGSLVATGTNSVSFSDLAVGDYYILLQSDDDCSVTLSFVANWATGVDRFDYAQSKVNGKFANGNGSISKASSLAAGYYSGLLTYAGDTDWYQIGNVYTEKYKVVLEGAAGMTVAEYDADGKLVQTAKYANGAYTMTVKSMNYLFVEGAADLDLDQVNAYSVSISGIQADAGEDVTPPDAPTASADVTTLTNGDVTVFAAFSEDSVKKEYSLDGGETWDDYDVNGIIIIINCTVLFRGIDEAGNISEVTSYVVGNIDKDAPTAPIASADVMTATNGDVIVSAVFSDDSVVKEYSLDGENWMAYTEAVKFEENGTVFFRGTDAAGNVSELTSYEVSNIEKSEPGKKDYKFLLGDFNGDGKAMLATVLDGEIGIYANGMLWGGLTLEDGWMLAGVCDFNGDGADDILRIHTSGLVIGEASDGNGGFTPQVLNFRNEGWSILGTGDFNSNVADDILIANPTAASDTVGLLGYWESGVTWTLINGYSAEWEMIATGDYNADGKCDMLWRNSFIGEGDLTYNAFCTWIVEPPEGESDWRMVSVANPAEWIFLCAGDFNGDGTNDIAMINDVGVVGIWGVEDGWLSSWSILSAVDTSAWTLAGIGDFNGDGTDDIAWCSNDTGLVGCWQIQDKELASWQTIATVIS